MSIQNEKLVNLADAKVLYDDLRGRVEDVDNQVIISNTQPTEEGNKLWVKSSGAGSSIEVPSYAEFEALQTSVEKFVVELTAPEDPQTHMPDFNSITCNKTIAEMTEAYNAGKEIVGILNYSVQKIGLQLSVTEASYGAITMLQFSFMSQQIGDGGVFQAIGYSNGEDVWFAGMYINLFGQIDYSSQGDTVTYNANNSKIAYVKDPTANKDAANKQYVDGAFAAPNPYLAPVELTAISTRAYAVGDIFICKGVTGGLFKATSAIAIGDTIVAGNTSGCNCVVLDNLVTNIPKDVQINGTSIVSNGVANIPYANGTTGGTVIIANNAAHGLQMQGQSNPGQLRIFASDSTAIKAGGNQYRPIVPSVQHISAFYGLAKAAGDTTQANSDNAVGVYTDNAKSSIQNMLGILDKSMIVQSYEDLTFPIPGGYVCEHDGALYITLQAINQQEEWTAAHWMPLGNLAVATLAGGSYYMLMSEVYPTVSQLPAVLPQLVAMSQIAPAEVSYTATKAYAVGDVFAYSPRDGSASSSKLLRATAAIAIGDTIVPGSSSGCNCEEVILTNVVPHDVQVNGTSVVSNGVANVPVASTSNYGAVKLGSSDNGLFIDNGLLKIYAAYASTIKAGSNSYRPIVPSLQQNSVFYGLAKAAGDTTQANSDNAVGTYTNDAKTAIKTMLGVTDPAVSDVQIDGTSILSQGVANIPIAGSGVIGAVAINTALGLNINPSNGDIYVNYASTGVVKAGTNSYNPITPAYQHSSAFYGLAKAAGDSTQASSSNAVGTYTPEAKAAIQTMIGVDPGVVFVEEVTGTTPTITGVSNTRYVCGEVAELTITPPASGTIDVRFTSGTTPTVLTIPSTVKFPDWVDLTTIEASTTYEIMITDGVYGGVMTWPV